MIRTASEESLESDYAAGLLGCLVLSLESVSAELGKALRGWEDELSNPSLEDFVNVLHGRAHALAMGTRWAMNWPHASASCRAAAQLVEDWSTLVAGQKALIAPGSHHEFEAAAAAFHRYMKARWNSCLRAACQSTGHGQAGPVGLYSLDVA